MNALKQNSISGLEAENYITAAGNVTLVTVKVNEGFLVKIKINQQKYSKIASVIFYKIGYSQLSEGEYKNYLPE